MSLDMAEKVIKLQIRALRASLSLSQTQLLRCDEVAMVRKLHGMKVPWVLMFREAKVPGNDSSNDQEFSIWTSSLPEAKSLGAKCSGTTCNTSTLIGRIHDTSITYEQLCLCMPRLTFRYKLYCDANYYSSDCSVYCVANNTNAGGHYTCDPATGNIVCRPGAISARLKSHIRLLT